MLSDPKSLNESRQEWATWLLARGRRAVWSAGNVRLAAIPPHSPRRDAEAAHGEHQAAWLRHRVRAARCAGRAASKAADTTQATEPTGPDAAQAADGETAPAGEATRDDAADAANEAAAMCGRCNEQDTPRQEDYDRANLADDRSVHFLPRHNYSTPNTPVRPQIFYRNRGPQ